MTRITLLYLATLVSLACIAGCASTGKTESAAAASDTGESASGSAKVIYNPAKQEEDTDSKKKEPSKEEPKKKKIEKSPMDSRVTLQVPAGTASSSVRTIGESIGGNLVLMAGTEERPVGELNFKRAKPAEVATAIAEAAGLAVQETPDYYFLFPPGYEALVDVSLAGKVPPDFGPPKTDVVFGYGLHLYTVFSWMSYALKCTIVADDAISDARCGELALTQVPLDAAVEAVLKSARVNKFAVDCTDEYLFIYNPDNANSREALLNSNELDSEQQQTLERRVTVILPEAPSAGTPLEIQQYSSRLGDILDSLSQQLGVTVVAEKGLEELPVNPVVLNHVKLRTALDLIVRQWLVPDYGYQMSHDRIVIRSR